MDVQIHSVLKGFGVFLAFCKLFFKLIYSLLLLKPCSYEMLVSNLMGKKTFVLISLLLMVL